MGASRVRVAKVALLSVTALVATGAGVWALLRVGLLLGLVGPFLGLALLGYAGYYLRSLV